MCKFIIENVQDKNPVSMTGVTPLHLGAIDGNLDICKLIIGNVEKKNPKDLNGTTPLHLAAKFGHFDVCKLIRLTKEILKIFRERRHFTLLPHSVIWISVSSLLIILRTTRLKMLINLKTTSSSDKSDKES